MSVASERAAVGLRDSGCPCPPPPGPRHRGYDLSLRQQVAAAPLGLWSVQKIPKFLISIVGTSGPCSWPYALEDSELERSRLACRRRGRSNVESVPSLWSVQKALSLGPGPWSGVVVPSQRSRTHRCSWVST